MQEEDSSLVNAKPLYLFSIENVQGNLIRLSTSRGSFLTRLDYFVFDQPLESLIDSLLTDDSLCLLMDAVECYKIEVDAVYYLTLAERSYFFLYQTLVHKKQYTQKNVHIVLDWLVQKGLQSDERYACAFVERLMRQKQVSKNYAFYALLSKNIDRSIAKAAVEASYPQEYEEHLCKKALEKKQRTTTDQHKIIASLQRKGFSYSLIHRCLTENDKEI